jgi:hypothetical protein
VKRNALAASDAAWTASQEGNDNREAVELDNTELADAVTLDDFQAFLPSHQYIFMPTGAMWPAGSVNSQIPPIVIPKPDGKDDKIAASVWLDRHRPVQQMTWAPGEPKIIAHRLPTLDGGWVKKRGARTFNLYRPPVIDTTADPRQAQRWIDHVHLVYPDDAEHIIDWLASRVQHPEIKINHAIVLGGAPGIGKDSILTPVRYAVGEWNCAEASPSQIMGRFNGFLKSVLLRVSEAHDSGETDRFKLYQHMKSHIAAPPEFHRIDEKHLREHPIPNVCGVIITTNHKTDGLYLPADDRRHYVAWSDLQKEDPQLSGGYFDALNRYYETGGNAAVSAYLRQRNLAKFNPKPPPPHTPAFWAMVQASADPDLADLKDLINRLDNPEAVTLETLMQISRDGVNGEFADWLADRRNRRSIPHKMEGCNYTPVHNDGQRDGRWKIAGRNVVIYALRSLDHHGQVRAARSLAAR